MITHVSSSWMDTLNELIENNHMLKHPFYQAWTKGTLSKFTLQTYAKQYYHHIKAFPTYLSSLHSRCDDLQIRKSLLENLSDEEMSNPNHIELWKQFALSLGISENDLDNNKPYEPVQRLIYHFKEACSSYSLAVGFAALYSYESQIPEICETKIEGLKKWYGITLSDDYQYFTEHTTADIEHSNTEKEILLRLTRTPNERKNILEGAKQTLDRLNDFLSSFELCA